VVITLVHQEEDITLGVISLQTSQNEMYWFCECRYWS